LSDRRVERQLDARSNPSGGVGHAGFFSAEHHRRDVENLDLVEAEPANDREGEFGLRIPPARLRVAVLPRDAVSLSGSSAACASAQGPAATTSSTPRSFLANGSARSIRSMASPSVIAGASYFVQYRFAVLIRQLGRGFRNIAPHVEHSLLDGPARSQVATGAPRGKPR
jgi:hypothetical protein